MYPRAARWLFVPVIFISIAPMQALCAQANVKARYTVQDLGAFPTNSPDEKPALNDNAQTVILRRSGRNEIHAQLADAASVTDIGTLQGYPNTFAMAINNNKVVVGYAQDKDDLRHTQAVVWNGNTLSDLPTLGGSYAVARGIDRAGNIVGRAQTLTGATHAVLWHQGHAVDLGVLPDGDFSEARNINDHNEIVGNANTAAGGKPHAFVFANGQMRDLGILPGGSMSNADAINNHGDIVGFADAPDNESRAVLWSGGTGAPIDLGNLGRGLSVAWAINDARQIVGYSTPEDDSAAFLWENGRMSNLNDLVAADSGWTFLVAYQINAHGEILARGLYKGEARACLLKPTL